MESRETQTLASNSSLSFECKESRRVFSDFNKVLYSINLLKTTKKKIKLRKSGNSSDYERIDVTYD